MNHFVIGLKLKRGDIKEISWFFYCFYQDDGYLSFLFRPGEWDWVLKNPLMLTFEESNFKHLLLLVQQNTLP